MGSVLLRNTRNITESGKTVFHYDIPTLTIAGELDGLLRVSRAAESYWHQYINIEANQQNMFPVTVIKGFCHASFMDAAMVPDSVKVDDLKPSLSEHDGHTKLNQVILPFIDHIEGKKDSYAFESDPTKTFLKPFIDSMELEGSYQMKEPCYDSTLVNRDSPKCMKGSPWSAQA